MSEQNKDAGENNFAFIYMPFVCRGKDAKSFMGVKPGPATIAHWEEVDPQEAAEEEKYLYSYVSGLRIGQESPTKIGHKYRHFKFTGMSDQGQNQEQDFLSRFIEVAKSDSPGLFDLDRKLTDDGPICDGGSSYLQGNTLNNTFSDQVPIQLEKCNCWRIRKAHRFPEPNECEPQDGKRFDESTQDRRYFLFTIRSVHCYCFNPTGIAILAFEISAHVPTELDPSLAPYWLSSMLFHLKKVQNVRIMPAIHEDYVEKVQPNNYDIKKTEPTGISFCNLGKLLASDLLGIPTTGVRGDSGRPYLFYQNPASMYRGEDDTTGKSIRSNTLSFVCVPQTGGTDTLKPLRYLTQCFDVNVPYSNSSTLQMKTLLPESDVAWGIATENVTCLAKESPYVKETYRQHVRYQFQFIYVLLLHQKFFYYLLLSEIVGARNGDMKVMEAYRDKLGEFNAAFTFSRITEVVQYQQFYELAGKAIGLDQLKSDVYEPLEQLVSLQREQESRRLEKYGILLALAGIGSVIVDVTTFIAGDGIDIRIKIGIIAVAAVIAIVVVAKYLSKRRNTT